MINFDTKKEKKIKFALDVEGIDSRLLEYFIRLSSTSTDLGFKGYLADDGILEFTIPPLDDIMKESKLKDIKTVKIEVHDKDNKFYLKPYQDMINIDHGSVSITNIEENNKNIKVKTDIKGDLDDNKKSAKSKFSKFLK